MLKDSDKRLALQAYEQILDLILSGETAPGSLLNERRIGEMLSMSRTPVRDALLMLEAEGLLVRQGKRGLQVKQMRIEDYMDALQIRLLLEPTLAGMAAGRVARAPLDALEAELEGLISEAEAHGQKADRGEVRSLDERLHGLISDAAGNPQLSEIIRKLRLQTQIFDLRSIPERLRDTGREHLEIVRAVRAGESEEASAAMNRHLVEVRGSIIARLTRS